jgi:hypothetical protein
MSKYDKLAGKQESEGDGRIWNRYGLSESEWSALSPTERVVHYNRMNKCEHKANMHDWPPDLRDSYSYDPYFHTAHMDPCKRWGIKPPARWAIECDCQMCLGKFGLTEEDLPRKVNEEAVRLKWQKKFAGN